MTNDEKQYLDAAEEIGRLSPGEFKIMINLDVRRNFQLVSGIVNVLEGKSVHLVTSWLLSIVACAAVTCASAGMQRLVATMLRKAAELVEAEEVETPRKEGSN